MKIKQQVEDFRVRELLADDVLQPRGEHRVYRVTKRKLTSLEAARILAEQVGASAGDVAMCGLKDRQGLTTQHMSLPRAKNVAIDDAELRISSVGYCARPLSAEASTGNAFEINVRGLDDDDLATLRENLAITRRSGLINYFDDQRFGNLRHNQGWIALDLLRGEHERALRTLLCAASEFESQHTLAFKGALDRAWGRWSECRDIAGRFGQHHSVFEALKKRPDDFAGAFFHVASRLRLIHLYAYQSHIWNRAVAQYVRNHTTAETRVVVDSGEGPLIYPGAEATLPAPYDAQFRLPGPRLNDVADQEQFALLADVLAEDRLVPAQFAIVGVPGFALKGEDRPLYVEPRHLRLGKPESDALNPPLALVKVRFELPRGAYATLVIRRLLAAPNRFESQRSRNDEVAPRREPRAATRRDEHRDDRRDDRARAPRSTGRPAPVREQRREQTSPSTLGADATTPAHKPSRRRRPGKDQRKGKQRGGAQS